MEFPVISMKRLEDENTRSSEMAKFAKACTEWEYFQLIDHGIPSEIMDAMTEALKSFFALPLEVKQHGVDSTEPNAKKPLYDNKGLPYINPRVTPKLGYKKCGVATFEIQNLDQDPPEDPKHSGWVEQLVLQFGNPEVNWPEKPDSLREKMENYGKEMENVGQKVLSFLALNVGLEPDAFSNAFKGSESSALTLTIVNCIPAPPSGVAGLTAPRHRDIGGVTIILVADGRQGFQLLKDGKWHSVSCVTKHSLLVNVGDLMEVMSNGRYKSLVHRAANWDNTMRISVATGYNPNNLAKIGPLAGLVDEQHPRLYGEARNLDFLEANLTKPMTCFEYFSSLNS